MKILRYLLLIGLVAVLAIQQIFKYIRTVPLFFAISFFVTFDLHWILLLLIYYPTTWVANVCILSIRDFGNLKKIKNEIEQEDTQLFEYEIDKEVFSDIKVYHRKKWISSLLKKYSDSSFHWDEFRAFIVRKSAKNKKVKLKVTIETIPLFIGFLPSFIFFPTKINTGNDTEMFKFNHELGHLFEYSKISNSLFIQVVFDTGMIFLIVYLFINNNIGFALVTLLFIDNIRNYFFQNIVDSEIIADNYAISKINGDKTPIINKYKNYLERLLNQSKLSPIEIVVTKKRIKNFKNAIDNIDKHKYFPLMYIPGTIEICLNIYIVVFLIRNSILYNHIALNVFAIIFCIFFVLISIFLFRCYFLSERIKKSLDQTPIVKINS